jgi:Ca-activated chloride channel family protein
MTPRSPATLILLLLAGAIPMVAQDATFSARIDIVRVDVLVLSGGQPLRGLRPEDFEVQDNGVPQQIDLMSFEQIPVNAILALDMSGSVAGERLDALRRASRALLDALKPDERAALISFSRAVVLRSPLTTDIAGVRSALDLAQPFGDTSLIDASYAGLVLGESGAGRPLLIVFSDGLDTASWLTAESVLDTARRSDTVVYGVSIAGLWKPPFLRDLSALTGGTLFEVESTNTLSRVFLNVLEEFRQRYLVSYSPRGVSKTGWHRLDVRIRNRSVTIKARPGYLAGT